jgi:hypothetical protein
MSPPSADRRLIILAALGAIVPLTTGRAQSGVDGPRGRFEDDLISNLEGRWHITRKIRGTEVENVGTATWVLNHQFLQLHMRDAASPPRYEAIVLIGYVYSDKQYVAHWTDTFGAKFSAIGRGTRIGNAIEFRFEYPDGPFFNTFNWLPEHGEWLFRMESQSSGDSRQLFATDALRPVR